MNLWNKLKELNSTDATPGWTKFITKYIMPLMIIGCGYGYWFVGELLNSTLSEFTNINTSINKVEFVKRTMNKPFETIKTDVYLITIDGLELHKKNISEYSIDQLSNLTTDELVEIFYHQQTGVIKEFRLNNEPIISLQSELETHRRGSIMIAIFFFGFLFWYLSRMYRYRKYGTI